MARLGIVWPAPERYSEFPGRIEMPWHSRASPWMSSAVLMTETTSISECFTSVKELWLIRIALDEELLSGFLWSPATS